MNKTAIEWCDYTWNPVTGCKHRCSYCYARKIAERFKGTKAWPQGFKPTLHPERAADPMRMKKRQTIFVCSMADLFGEWVPDEWISNVMASCDVAPWHTYIFLTKNPERYLKIHTSFFRENKWFGTTVSHKEDVHRIDVIRSLPRWINKFVSFEPLLETIDTDLGGINQVIIGAQTNPDIIPPDNAVGNIVRASELNEIPVFCKDSLPDWNCRRELAWNIHKVSA